MKGIGWLVMGATAAAGAAEASPWAQEAGGIYARATASAERLSGKDGWRGDLYGEYGLKGRWTLTGKAEAVRYDGGGVSDRDALRASLRRQLWSSKSGWALGAELGAVHGSAVAGVAGCDGWGGEARASVGRSGVYRDRSFYVFADAAHIAHEDGCTRNRFEAGYGADLSEHWFSEQQVWLEQGNQTADSAKLETRVGYHFKLADLSVGYRKEFGGDFTEQAWLVSLTVRR